MGDIIGEIFGWVGSVLATIFFLSPIVPFSSLIKDEITYKDTPGVLLIMSFFNCILWGVYGLRGDLTQVYVTNFLGCFITFIFIVIYLIYLTEEKILTSIIYNIIALNFLVEIFYISYALCNNDYVGNAATVFNVLMYAAPGEKIYKVYQTQKYDLLPIISSICGLASATCWFTYGVYKNNSNLMIPNALGIFFAVLQIIVWFIFYRKKKNNNDNDDDNNDYNDVESNEKINSVKE